MLVVQKKFPPSPSTRQIIIRGDKKTIVSSLDYAWLNKFKWFLLKSASSSYVVTRKIIKGKTYTIRMHRLILQAPPFMKVHHINHDTLDNRRENLMLVTEREHRHFDGWHIFRPKNEGKNRGSRR